MSCTIFYKGTLKDNNNPDDVLITVSKHLKSINGELSLCGDTIIIKFLQGQSEPLVFNFNNGTVDAFCKWNGEEPGDFYAIFDMLIELKPLFKSFSIEDDEGHWHEYVINKQPCKIKLRPLSMNEMRLLQRIKMNEANSLDATEKLVMDKSELRPFNKALLRIIVQDFIQIMGINEVDDFVPQVILDLTNELDFGGETSYKEKIEWFNFHFNRMLIIIWLSYAFEYKNLGIVKNVAESVRGIVSSKIAATDGIASIFLNRHTGGASNSKEAEMRKLAKKHYRSGALGEVMVIDNPERELEFFFSMMDYLGFKYVGIT